MHVGGNGWKGIPPQLQGLNFKLAVGFQNPHSYHNFNLQGFGEEFCVVLYSF